RLGNRSVKDIGFSLGYQSESIFSSAFKRIYGLSPKTYRATMRCL
ncbi:helix-turn-helix domain-containing protein, partial [Klebsiella pneumoniae]